jgi:hypothetical protein
MRITKFDFTKFWFVNVLEASVRRRGEGGGDLDDVLCVEKDAVEGLLLLRRDSGGERGSR